MERSSRFKIFAVLELKIKTDKLVYFFWDFKISLFYLTSLKIRRNEREQRLRLARIFEKEEEVISKKRLTINE